MLSDNVSTSDSFSDDDAGANSSGYIRRKTRNTRCTFRDQFSDRIGATGDESNLNRGRRTDGVNVIDIGSHCCEGVNDDEENISGEPVN